MKIRIIWVDIPSGKGTLACEGWHNTMSVKTQIRLLIGGPVVDMFAGIILATAIQNLLS
jgi:hypothetical protein